VSRLEEGAPGVPGAGQLGEGLSVFSWILDDVSLSSSPSFMGYDVFPFLGFFAGSRVTQVLVWTCKSSELHDEINTIEGGMFRRFFLQSFFGFRFLLLGFGHFFCLGFKSRPGV